MKRYTFETILKLPTRTGMPKPFQGRYPTRIAYEIVYHAPRTLERHVIRYIGKPSQAACQRWFKLHDAHRRSIAYSVRGWVFDRGTVFFQYAAGNRNVSDGHVWTAYYPGVNPESVIGIHNRYGNELVQRLAGGFRYYDFHGCTVHAEMHRLWLNDTFKLKLPAPPPKVAAKPKVDPLDKPEVARRMVRRRLNKYGVVIPGPVRVGGIG